MDLASLFIMYLVVSVIGAVGVAAIDAQHSGEGRPVPQH